MKICCIRLACHGISLRRNLLQSLCLTLLLPLAVSGNAQPAPHAPVVQSYEADAQAVHVLLTNGILRIKLCGENMVRVTYVSTPPIPELTNPVTAGAICTTTAFHVQSSDRNVEIVTSSLRISVDRNSGAVHFAGLTGDDIVSETDWPFPRSLQFGTGTDAATRSASAWFALSPDERLYGLGQHQNGLLDQRNLEMELSQDNTNISIPFFLSSRGYGIFWDNTSVTQWNNRFQQVLSIHSDVADAVDYYFIYGPAFDKIISGYRQLTGSAPLFPLWAYGYWQSKLAYTTQPQLLEVAAKYRALKIPLDNIVLDAGWETRLGSRSFTQQYPAPRAMIKTLHDEHVNLMVSVWPLFDSGTTNFEAMSQQQFFVGAAPNGLPSYLPGGRLYDAFNKQARTLYWDQIRKSLYDIGVDAYWMDSTEPGDMFGEGHRSMLAGAQTAVGDGSRYENMYPLMTTAAIYQGQRSVTDRKRVFILTRSAFAGMQRNAAAAWSGDTTTTFQTFKRQIPAGLNYSMTGLPYWTSDIGGFVGGDTSDPAYRELFVRWFQYGSFCPVFRAHGARKNNQNELWSFGEEDQAILTTYDRLRYRLLPYIYSIAARTTFDGYTPMRALAFDFREDTKALDISDEFMFGPSLLVAPVTEAGATSRSVYLPGTSDWYDFWNGERVKGGLRVDRATPLKIMPLYVRAGTILPLGPEAEYSGQYPRAPIELRIYPGKDGELSLYQDDGTTYDYEKGLFSRIPINWDDRARLLTIGSRQGSFPEMQSKVRFHATIVKPSEESSVKSEATEHGVLYDGSPQQIRF